MAPIPPPSTAQGELIFSPRVDSSVLQDVSAADTAAFQSGYQRYRTQWLRARGQRGAETKS